MRPHKLLLVCLVLLLGALAFSLPQSLDLDRDRIQASEDALQRAADAMRRGGEPRVDPPPPPPSRGDPPATGPVSVGRADRGVGAPRTDIRALVPTLLVEPGRVTHLDARTVQQVPAGENAIKHAYAAAQPGDVIGFVGKHGKLIFGDGKPVYYKDSVNKPGGVQGIALVGLDETAATGPIQFWNGHAATSGQNALVFANFTIDASFSQAGVLSAHSQPAIFGIEFEKVTVLCGPSTKWAWRLHGPTQFSIRHCTALRAINNAQAYTLQEHLVYADNMPGPSEVIYCSVVDAGRTHTQFVNRVESGPPTVGPHLIMGNVSIDNRDASAITVSGFSDPDHKVFILHNTVLLQAREDGNGGWTQTGGTSNAGALAVWGEGAAPSKGKIGAWPVGSEGNEGWNLANPVPHSAQMVSSVYAAGNTWVGFNMKKPLTSISDTVRMEFGQGETFRSNNRPAIELGYTGSVDELVLAFGADYQGMQCAGKIKLTEGGNARMLSDGEIDAFKVAPATPAMPVQAGAVGP